ncbi:hypothetical protein ABQ359_22195 [Serratia fonticola]|uniref:hypothetical protein n=1 Tax=Serratia fonticola TaxID=47917 RepID=UPI003AAA65FE
MTISTERLRKIASGSDFVADVGGKQSETVTEIARELLAVREAQSEPVQWGAPKTVRQLIQQLQTLDQDLETTALLRMPADFRDGNAIRQVPLSISYERLNGQWLAQYKGDGRLVLAFWAKADDRPEGERGELLTVPPAPAVPNELPNHAGPREFGRPQAYIDGWNACRAAMLNHVGDSAEKVPADYQHLKHVSESYFAVEKRLFDLAQRLKGPSFDHYAYSLHQAIDVLDKEIFGESEDNSAMLAAAPTPTKAG